MTSYRITAQSYTSSQRIARTVAAISADAALRSVASVLDAAGFYPISADAI